MRPMIAVQGSFAEKRRSWSSSTVRFPSGPNTFTMLNAPTLFMTTGPYC